MADMKILSFLRRTTPNSPDVYGDLLTVLLDSNVLGTFRSRTWPNPHKPETDEPFDTVYGGLAPGHYTAIFIAAHPKFGTCFELDDGGELPCLWPNSNHNMRAVLSEVFVHHGETAGWSGSAGCLTIDPSQAEQFFGMFVPGEAVVIEVKVLP